MCPNKILVTYLEWPPAGPAVAQAFSKSYNDHPAGVEHSFVVIHPQGDNFDIGNYLIQAPRFKEEFVCFLNSYVTLESDGWLEKLYRHASADGVGLVGAMGSYETMGMGAWLPWPNPHIRTNGFMIRRELLLSFGFTPPKDKVGCYAFESGPQSLTKRVLALGLKTLVVGANGVAYDIPDWPISKTFRLGNQENLLLHDRHSRMYAKAKEAELRQLKMNAWREA